MTFFKNRLPPRPDILATFGVCLVLIHLWAIYNTLRAVPSWLLSMDLWELTGTIAYTQVYALLESVALLLGLVALAVVLPAGWLRDKFTSLGALTALLTTAWGVFMAYYGVGLNLWNRQGILLTLLALAFAVVVFGWLVQRIKPFGKFIGAVAERLLVLGWLYLGIDLLSIAIVVIRNIT